MAYRYLTLLGPHSVILAGCKHGRKPGLQPGLQLARIMDGMWPEQAVCTRYIAVPVISCGVLIYHEQCSYCIV